MRVAVGNCAKSVMGDKKDTIVTTEQSRQLRMCPLTSSISISESHSNDVGSLYPRRILLSFLRQRLVGKQDQTHSHHRYPSYSEVNSKAIDKRISQVVSSEDIKMEVGSSCTGGCGCNDHTETRFRRETKSGGMRNHCVSGPTFAVSSLKTKFPSCSCLPLHNISNFNTPENHSQRNTSLLGDSNKFNSLTSISSQSLYSIECNHHLSLENGTVSHGRGLVWTSVMSSLSRRFNIVGNSFRSRSRCYGGLIKVLLFVFVLFLVTGSASACGPGRGAGRRRAPRKLTPLVYKQHVPNVPENTLSASGFTEGRITRKDHKFKNLVPNYNQDIIFRDEEGTGADRLMTQRCKEKLNTLAISVMNQWPGVKLRVNEGWDEDLHHATHSLHYEGRAVDITTSDKDRSKYGMLARLAVEAGFDWVYYESRAHIHCSVKSDSSQASRTGGCFNGNSTVETPEGPKKMTEVQPGDKILTVDSNGKEVYSDVLMFLDRNTTEVREFFELTTESGAKLTLTPSHLLYSIQPEGVTPDDEWLLNKNQYLKPDEISKYYLDQAEVTFAKFVQIGDWVLVKNQQTISHKNSPTYTVEKVINIEAKIQTGVYAPLTVTGNLVVDGVLSSCYALIDDQTLAHVAFAPVRLAHNFRQSVAHLWKQFSRFVSFSHHDNEISTDHHLSTRKDVESDIHAPREMSPSVAKSLSNSYLNDNQGIHWYASFLYSATRYILPASLIYE